MNKREIKRAILLAQDFTNILTDYCSILDDYFKDENNKVAHYTLYCEYQTLSFNLKDAVKKRGFDK